MDNPIVIIVCVVGNAHNRATYFKWDIHDPHSLLWQSPMISFIARKSLKD